MTGKRCFYMFWSNNPPDWDDSVGCHQQMPLGRGLTDSRFIGGGVPWEPDTFRLGYMRKGSRPYATVGQYLPPEFAKLWQEAPVHIKLSGARAQARRFPKRMKDILQPNDSPIISGRVREIIESVEPGRHQFIPVKILAWDTLEELYADQEPCIINILNWVAPDQLFDTKVMLESYADVGREKYGEPFSFRIEYSKFDDYRIRPDWLDTGHLLRTGSYRPRPSQYWSAPEYAFASEVLYKALKAKLGELIPDIPISIGEPSPYWRMVLQKKSEFN